MKRGWRPSTFLILMLLLIGTIGYSWWALVPVPAPFGPRLREATRVKGVAWFWVKWGPILLPRRIIMYEADPAQVTIPVGRETRPGRRKGSRERGGKDGAK